MFGHKFARAFLASTAIVGTGFALPAMAQQIAPVRQSVDGNGVDLFLGKVNYDGPTLSAGQDDMTGLTYKKIGRSLGSGDNLWASLYVSGSTTTISMGAFSDSFTLSGGVYTSTEANGATLSLSSGIYTYTAHDGTLIHFTTAKEGAYPYQTSIAMVTDATMPNGAVLTYSYDSLYYCSSYKELSNGFACLQHSYKYRQGSVTSKGGYSVGVSYNPIDPWDESQGEFPDFATWSTPTGVVMWNTAITGSSIRSQTFATSFSGGNGYTTITDPMSRVTVFRRSTTSFGIRRPGKTAEDITYTYDTSGRVANVTTPVGTTTYAYADNTTTGIRTTTVTDPGGHATVYTFNIASNRMLSATNPLSKTTSWQYDASGRLIRVTAPEGNYTQYTYDARGNVTETRNVAKSGSGLADIVLDAGYDTTCTNAVTCNQPNWTKDAKGNQTDYTYDTTTGNVSTVTAPAATVGGIQPKTTYSYMTTSGVQLLTGTSTCQTTASCVGTADEAKTIIGYNSNLLPTTVTKAAGDNSLSATTTIGYDDVGNVLTVDGPLAGTADTTTYRYDADRERVGTISADPDGAGALKRRAVRTTYNDRGIATLVEVGTVNGTTDTDWSAFTSLQQVATTLDSADRKSQVALNAGGTTYALTQYSYDTDGRLDCTAVRMKPSTYTSLPTSACTATTGTGDADRITKMTYDNANRVTKQTSAYGSTIASDDATATYTDNGKVATLSDAEGNKTSYTYDGFDRLSKTSYPSLTKGSGTSSTTDYEQLGYDANSNISSRRLRDGNSIAYTYDNLNRRTTKDLPGTEPTATYGYDLLGRLTTVSNTGTTVTRAYDALSRLTSETQPFGTMSYQYDAAGQRTRLTWWDGFYVTYDHQVTGEVTAIKENGSTALVTFGYDDLGRRTSLTRGNGTSTTYGFDAVSRLSSLTADLSGTTNDLTLGFGYNPASQIASTTRSNTAYSWTGAVNVARNYTSNGLNQYSAATSTSFSYDARGNLTSSGGDTYAYSAENLLTTKTGSAFLYYDGFNRLTEYDTSVSTRFVYDGGEIVAEVANPSGAILRRYVAGMGSDEPLVWYEGSGTSDKRWLVSDERGSIVSVTNSSGGSIATNTYDEFGIPGPGNLGRFQYTGQAWLPEVGLYYYKARMYSPTLGRFMQTDPVGYGDGMNWYNYVGGDPINGGDPTGLDAKWEWDCYGNCGGGYWNSPVSPPSGRVTVEGTSAGGGTSSSNGSNSNAVGTGNGTSSVLYKGGDITITATQNLLASGPFESLGDILRHILGFDDITEVPRPLVVPDLGPTEGGEIIVTGTIRTDVEHDALEINISYLEARGFQGSVVVQSIDAAIAEARKRNLDRLVITMTVANPKLDRFLGNLAGRPGVQYYTNGAIDTLEINTNRDAKYGY